VLPTNPAKLELNTIGKPTDKGVVLVQVKMFVVDVIPVMLIGSLVLGDSKLPVVIALPDADVVDIGIACPTYTFDTAIGNVAAIYDIGAAYDVLA
jgi:hypothetical protein